jgi:transposase
MNECTHIGLDVHKDTIAVAVLRPHATEVDERVIPNTPESIRRLLARHDPTATHLCYEAGPTGYDTHRLVAALGFGCDVIAPSLIPRKCGSRVKTDRIDARNLARLNRAGELTSVRVPGTAEEAVRDLIRVREEVKCDRRVARQRIRSFLLRYGKRYPGPRDAWSHRFEVWARAVTFDEPLATEAFQNLTAAYFIRDTQLSEMGRRI